MYVCVVMYLACALFKILNSVCVCVLCVRILLFAISPRIAQVCMNTVLLHGDRYMLWILTLLLKILTILLRWVSRICYYVVISFTGLEFCDLRSLTWLSWVDMLADIRELISLDDVMEELGLGPNGGLVYCMEYPFFWRVVVYFLYNLLWNSDFSSLLFSGCLK